MQNAGCRMPAVRSSEPPTVLQRHPASCIRILHPLLPGRQSRAWPRRRSARTCACTRSHSVSSSDCRASFSSVDVITPFSYDTCAIDRLSRASSTRLALRRRRSRARRATRCTRWSTSRRPLSSRRLEAVLGLPHLRQCRRLARHRRPAWRTAGCAARTPPRSCGCGIQQIVDAVLLVLQVAGQREARLPLGVRERHAVARRSAGARRCARRSGRASSRVQERRLLGQRLAVVERALERQRRLRRQRQHGAQRLVRDRRPRSGRESASPSHWPPPLPRAARRGAPPSRPRSAIRAIAGSCSARRTPSSATRTPWSCSSAW